MASSNPNKRGNWWLRCPSGDTPLTGTELVIGRDLGCHLRFIDDALISRTHARVFVEDGQVVIEDLGSTNGTFVDEQRIGGRRDLTAGARIRIGTQLLWLYRGENPPRGARNATTSAEIPRYRRRQDSDSNTTGNASVFSLLGPTAEIALGSGQTDEVIRILEPYMDQILGDVRRKRAIDPEVAAQAYDYALRLAQATKHGAWLDYLVELAEVSGIPIPRSTSDRVEAVAALVDVAERDWRRFATRPA